MKHARTLVAIIVVSLGLVAIASTAWDHLQAESLYCQASPVPGGGWVVIGC